MFNLSMALPILAAILHGAGYTLYNRQMLKGVTKPNPASLFVWLFLAVLNAATFTAMTDWRAALQMYVGSAGITLTFFYALFAGKLRWLKRGEWVTLVLCLLSIWVWKHTDATLANMVLVVAAFLSFAPYLYGLWNNPRLDRAQAWYFFTAAWTTTSVSTFVFDGGLTAAMVMPVTMSVLHLVVALLCLESRKVSWLTQRRGELSEIENRVRQLDEGAFKLRKMVQLPSFQGADVLGATGFALYTFNQERERLLQRKTELEKLGIA